MPAALLDEPRSTERASARAFWAEVLDCLPALHAYAQHLTRDEEAAHDLVHDTVLRGFRFRKRYRLGTNCGGWLATILRNLWLSGFHSGRRRFERTEADDLDSLPGFDMGEDRILGHLSAEEVREAVRAVPEPFRSAVVMADANDLSYAQVAALLGVPVGTVKSRVCRGRRLLRRRLRVYATG